MPKQAKLGIYAYNHNLKWMNNYALAIKALHECRDSPSLKHTEKFGPRMWAIIHKLISQYPIEPTKEEIVGCARLFNDVAESIPCKECRQHYLDMLANRKIVPHPIVDIAPRGNLIMNVLTWNMHNNVNKRLKKTLFKWHQYVETYKPLVSELDGKMKEFYSKYDLI